LALVSYCNLLLWIAASIIPDPGRLLLLKPCSSLQRFTMEEELSDAVREV
jgi:hypothetical protein